MKERRKLDRLLALEKDLLKNYENKTDRIIINEKSFDEQGFTIEGFNRLKEEINYIELDCDFKIIVPGLKQEIFKRSLRHYISKELFYINKKNKQINSVVLLLLILGITIMTSYYFFLKDFILSQLFVIVSWVFIWSAIEKFFFEKPALNKESLKLLLLLDSLEKCDDK